MVCSESTGTWGVPRTTGTTGCAGSLRTRRTVSFSCCSAGERAGSRSIRYSTPSLPGTLKPVSTGLMPGYWPNRKGSCGKSPKPKAFQNLNELA
jgi:hypothetical protein